MNHPNKLTNKVRPGAYPSGNPPGNIIMNCVVMFTVSLLVALKHNIMIIVHVILLSHSYKHAVCTQQSFTLCVANCLSRYYTGYSVTILLCFYRRHIWAHYSVFIHSFVNFVAESQFEMSGTNQPVPGNGKGRSQGQGGTCSRLFAPSCRSWVFASVSDA